MPREWMWTTTELPNPSGMPAVLSSTEYSLFLYNGKYFEVQKDTDQNIILDSDSNKLVPSERDSELDENTAGVGEGSNVSGTQDNKIWPKQQLPGNCSTTCPFNGGLNRVQI